MPPVRTLPAGKARPVELLCFGAAGVSALAPLCMIFPSNQARLGRQTARWGPTWERNVSYLAHPLERGIQRVAPPLERAVRAIDAALPLERVARGGEYAARQTILRFVGPPKK